MATYFCAPSIVGTSTAEIVRKVHIYAFAYSQKCNLVFRTQCELLVPDDLKNGVSKASVGWTGGYCKIIKDILCIKGLLNGGRQSVFFTNVRVKCVCVFDGKLRFATMG